MENIYKAALANKLRFPFKGQIDTEDLFDLNLTDLDSVYKALSRQIKAYDEESLLSVRSDDEMELEIKLQIVKELFNDRLAQIEKTKEEKKKREKNQRILELISEKEDEKLKELSVEELKSMLD